MVSPDTRLNVPKHVLSRDLDGETVILDVAGGMYYGLTDVGTNAWELFSEGLSVDEVCKKLLETYDVEPEVLGRDINALVEDLLEKKLLTKRIGNTGET